MKKYKNYKQTGIEWIGEIPKDWSITKIKYSTYVKGRIGWKGLRSSDFTNVGPYLVTGTDFDKGRINWNTCYHVSEDRYDEDPYIQLKNGDVLITKDGTIGKVAVVNNLDEKATLNSGIFVTRPTTGLYKDDYFYWVLNSEAFDKFIDFNKTGSTVLHLYQNVFNEFQFPIPSLEEQEHISIFISYKISLIDNLISKNNQLIQLLEEKKQATINQAVTKGLDPNVKMKDSGVEWIGKIPEHWSFGKLSYFAKVQNGSTPSKSKNEYWENGTVPWISSSKVNEEVVNEPSELITKKALMESPLNLIPKNSVIVGMVGQGKTRGMSSILDIDTTINQNLASITPLSSRLIGKYLYYFFISSYKGVRNMGRGANQKALNCEIISSIRLAIPQEKEQKNIVDYLNKYVSISNRSVETLKRKNSLLKEYRQAHISNAVTGKIDVRDEQVPEEFIKDQAL